MSKEKGFLSLLSALHAMEDSSAISLTSHTPPIVGFFGLSYCIYKLHAIHKDLGKLMDRSASTADASPPLLSPVKADGHGGGDTTSASCSGWWPVNKGGKPDA